MALRLPFVDISDFFSLGVQTPFIFCFSGLSEGNQVCIVLNRAT